MIGHTSFNYAMNHVEPTLVATFILLEPIGAAIMALVIFAAHYLLLLARGCCLVGVVLTARNTRSHG